MKLTMLGTGNALVTEVYNTCFVLSEDNQHMLVDGGGGNGLLQQLKKADIRWQDIHTIFVTHKHIDHLLGIVWMIRLFTQGFNQGIYTGEATIYAHDEVIDLLDMLAKSLLQKKQTDLIGKVLHLVKVEDGDRYNLIGHEVTFFDIHSTKAKQFGFSMKLNDSDKLTCCGDEPYSQWEEAYVRDSKWLLHEAFCLDSQKDVFRPYEKHHSTVKDACELAERLNIKNLVLYHTEDRNIEQRKSLYTIEGGQCYSGNLFVPEDLEVFEL